ncbi:hypothetical protein [Streptomyces zingiberis]|uniref:hypothetical protein n=1 Tax=Streptomyces zingiberis TaxID=2053010 RepID=UPI002892B528|nr:hypothetical protein [Streptomyces zingiberis]
MVGEFRRTVVLLPLSGGRCMTGRLGGIRWIYAFTGEPQLARFALARGPMPGERRQPGGPGGPWEYASVLGARVLDVLVPGSDGPTGVAIDVAEEDGAMLLPPVRGIVPEAVAVDARPGDAPTGGAATAGVPSAGAPPAVEWAGGVPGPRRKGWGG